MCPEPEFGPEYRALIETYRLTPEAAAYQLDMILEHFFRERKGRSKADARIPEKGGTPH